MTNVKPNISSSNVSTSFLVLAVSKTFPYKFLKDLADSRFNEALPIFKECVNGVCVYNYNQYFKYDY